MINWNYLQALKFLHQNLSSSKYLLTKLFWNDVQKTATGTWWYWHGLISLIGIFLSVLRLCPGNVIWFKLFILNLSYTTSTKIGVFKPVAQRGCNRTDQNCNIQLRAKDQELFHRSNWLHFAVFWSNHCYKFWKKKFRKKTCRCQE